MMAWRPLALAVAALLAAALPTTARAQDGSKVTLTFANWADAENATRPGIEKIIQDFEKTHPNIEIQSQPISFSEIARQLVLRVRAGNAPDVAELQGNDVILLGLTGKLEPLETYIGKDEMAALIPVSLAGLSVRGKLIGFPWNLSPAALWYNKAIMQKAGLDPASPPKTIDALMADMAAIKKTQPSVIPLGMDTTNRPFALSANWAWMQTFGANPLADSGKGAESPAMKSYLGWMRELAQKGYIEPGQKMGDFRPLAAQDKVAFTWDSVLLQGVIQSINHMPSQDFYNHWGVTPLPTGATGKSFTFEGRHDLVIFASSPHKQAAWEFINYLATSANAIENYTIRYETSLMPLETAPSPEIAKLYDTPVFQAFINTILPTVETPPYGASFAPAATAVMAGIQQAVTGTTPIDAIAAAMHESLARD
jgi:multiple sugar transport system substrate-binding protein